MDGSEIVARAPKEKSRAPGVGVATCGTTLACAGKFEILARRHSHGVSAVTVTRSILQRTFKIRYDNSLATGFTLDADNKRYLVTARHVAGTVGDEGSIDILQGANWVKVPVLLVGHGEGDVDVSVLAPQVLFGSALALSITSAKLTLAEDVFFLGYPYGLSSHVGKAKTGWPLPLVKKATVSALYPREGMIMLDGHNNPGFSGGPIVRSYATATPQTVIAVVSGYLPDEQRVHDLAGNEAPYTYATNTGIVVAYDVMYVRQLIAANPIGIDAQP